VRHGLEGAAGRHERASSVHSIALAGSISVFDVGFESGRITGIRACFAIARITGSVNVPGVPVAD